MSHRLLLRPSGDGMTFMPFCFVAEYLDSGHFKMVTNILIFVSRIFVKPYGVLFILGEFSGRIPGSLSSGFG